MSTPTSGPDPNVAREGDPQDQSGWAAPPARDHGGSAPGYRAGVRPSQILVAAGLGFFVALFSLLVALSAFAFSTLSGVFAIFGIVFLALTVVNVWGGVAALLGRGGTILRIAGLVTTGIALLGFVLALTQGAFSIWYLLLVIAGAATFVLLDRPQSLEFFAARGAR